MHGKKVFIIGLGLIGGSLALAIKKNHPAVSIFGYDVDHPQQELAKSLGIIDFKANQMKEGAEDADLIVIAAPVLKAEDIIEQLANCPLKKDAIVTDAGSTKKEVMKKAQCLYQKGVAFIGGHPIAGSHKSGIAAAEPHLFENAYYVLVANGVDHSKVEQLKSWLSGTRATFIEMAADQHDLVVGVISHFPHIIAAGLVHRLSEMDENYGGIRHLAAGGFRDITRIASSSPAMWHDVLIHNRSVLLDLMSDWQKEMEHVKTMIETMDSDQIYTYFQDAKHYRDGLPQRKKGALPSFFDLYVDVPDYPGVIAKVTECIAHVEISITNIRIIETREDIIGALRLSFRNEKDREHARKVLNEQNYKTYLVE